MTYDACKAFMRLSLLQQAAAAAALAATLAACSGIPRPTEQIEAAQAAVANARPVAAQEGAPELGLAQAKLARAENAIARGDYVEARVLAEQAEVDAKYAQALADSARLQRQLQGRAK